MIGQNYMRIDATDAGKNVKNDAICHITRQTRITKPEVEPQ